MSDVQRPPPPDFAPRRHLTILFTDLSDSTRLSGTMEVETYAELTHDLRHAFVEIVQGHGGIVNQFQGDGLQAVFGYPHSTERDGVHAAEAALLMHETVRALRARYAEHGAGALSVHSGIHAGLALAQAGTEAAARVELFGPVPGIAKHLSDLAEGDEILVSEETLGPGSQFFQTQERRLLQVKGHPEPMAVHRILARTGLRTRFEAHSRRGLVPLAGRLAELQRIDEALDAVAKGHVRVLALCGAAGVGKTRLAEECLPRALSRGFAVLGGYCEEELSAQPLQPLLQMLRARFGLATGAGVATAVAAVEQGLAAIDPALLSWRAELLRALSIAEADDTAAPTARRPAPERTIAALRDVVAALARRQPLLVFIDDWQWADGATRQVVAAIAVLAEAPILLLLTVRGPASELPELLPAQMNTDVAAEVIPLDPLDEVEAAATIGRLLPGADPFVAADIRRFAGGNPLFIEELCHSARVAGVGRPALPLERGSAWLETLIESRVARLGPEHREVLDTAAVIGNVVPGWLVKRLCGRAVNDPVVRGLAGLDLVYPARTGERTADEAGDTGSDSLRFKHGITRHVVYATLGRQRRRELHRRVAELVAAQTDAAALGEACEALAYHWAGADEYEAAARFAEIAGDKAMAASALDRARAQYGAAIDMLDHLPDTHEHYQAWRSVVRRLGLVSVFDPARGDLAVFARAVAKATEHGDAAGLAYGEYWLAYVTYALGESKAAVRQAERALHAATVSGDAALQVQAQALHGQALAAAAGYALSLQRLDESARAIRARPAGGRPVPGLAYSLACKASVLGDLGRFADAHACFAEALVALPAPGHEVEGSVLCWRAAVHLWQGRWDDAQTDALAARQIAERVKSLYLTAMSRALGAAARWRLAPADAAQREMADAVVWLDARDKNLFVSLIHGWLAEALAAVAAAPGSCAAADGDDDPAAMNAGVSAGMAADTTADMPADMPADARRHAAWTLHRARKSDWTGAAMAMRAMARLDTLAGRERQAQRHLARAEQVAAVRTSPHEAANNELARARLALAFGRRAEAAAALDRAGTAFERLQMPWHLEQVKRLLDAG